MPITRTAEKRCVQSRSSSALINQILYFLRTRRAQKCILDIDDISWLRQGARGFGRFSRARRVSPPGPRDRPDWTEESFCRCYLREGLFLSLLVASCCAPFFVALWKHCLCSCGFRPPHPIAAFS